MEKPRLAGIRLHAPENELEKFSESIDEYPESQVIERYEDQLRPNEKLTADTRLSFDERRIIDDYRNAQEEFLEPLQGETPQIDFGVKKKADYRIREQAEYDRLISGVTEPTTTSVDLENRITQPTNAWGTKTVATTSTEKPSTVRIVPGKPYALQKR
ncbi:unnamed protein product [Gongylonema pulchrum]|uniref:DNA methylase n=1 Tax=Gongylonema pulchrum TaxID=637853 RepID=A0A183D6U4_9BILA|nr:unnamed protein product [Gongylonema pulchrum]